MDYELLRGGGWDQENIWVKDIVSSRKLDETANEELHKLYPS
jgi:hypothetical protein